MSSALTSATCTLYRPLVHPALTPRPARREDTGRGSLGLGGGLGPHLTLPGQTLVLPGALFSQVQPCRGSGLYPPPTSHHHPFTYPATTHAFITSTDPVQPALATLLKTPPASAALRADPLPCPVPVPRAWTPFQHACVSYLFLLPFSPLEHTLPRNRVQGIPSS